MQDASVLMEVWRLHGCPFQKGGYFSLRYPQVCTKAVKEKEKAQAKRRKEEHEVSAKKFQVVKKPKVRAACHSSPVEGGNTKSDPAILDTLSFL